MKKATAVKATGSVKLAGRAGAKRAGGAGGGTGGARGGRKGGVRAKAARK